MDEPQPTHDSSQVTPHERNTAMEIPLTDAALVLLQRQATDREMSLADWIADLALERELAIGGISDGDAEPLATLMNLTENSDPDDWMYSDELAEQLDTDELEIKHTMKALAMPRRQDWDRAAYRVEEFRERVQAARRGMKRRPPRAES